MDKPELLDELTPKERAAWDAIARDVALRTADGTECRLAAALTTIAELRRDVRELKSESELFHALYQAALRWQRADSGTEDDALVAVWDATTAVRQYVDGPTDAEMERGTSGPIEQNPSYRATARLATVIAHAQLGEYQCATCQDIGLLADAHWDGATTLYCSRCARHTPVEADIPACPDCVLGPTRDQIIEACLREGIGLEPKRRSA